MPGRRWQLADFSVLQNDMVDTCRHEIEWSPLRPRGTKYRPDVPSSSAKPAVRVSRWTHVF